MVKNKKNYYKTMRNLNFYLSFFFRHKKILISIQILKYLILALICIKISYLASVLISYNN